MKAAMTASEMNLIKGGSDEVFTDIDLLNPSYEDEGMSNSGNREKLGCYLIYKVYLCANFEVICPQRFTYSDCKGLFSTCSSNFSIKPF